MPKLLETEITLIERNPYGAWVIHGSAGTMQYYYYTKDEAVERYLALSTNTYVNET